MPICGGHAPRRSATLRRLRGRSGSGSSRPASNLRLRDPTRPPIGTLGHLLLIPVVAVLAIVAALVGWHALHPGAAPEVFAPPEGSRTLTWPAPIDPDVRPLPPMTGRAVDAALATPAGAGAEVGTPLLVLPRGTPAAGLEVVVFDAQSGIRRASQPLHGTEPLRFDALPAGDLEVALVASGRSARHQNLTAAPVRLPAAADTGDPVSVELPVTTQSVTVELELVAVPQQDSGASTPVTVSVRRRDHPEWRGPSVSVACHPDAAAPLPIELGPFGAGAYELLFVGFVPASGEVVSFDVPRTGPIRIRGALE